METTLIKLHRDINLAPQNLRLKLDALLTLGAIGTRERKGRDNI